MCTRCFVTILAAWCLLGPLAGCAALDRAAADLQRAGTAARQEARDPASPLPGPARTALELAGLAVWAASSLYQQARGKRVRKDLDQAKQESDTLRRNATQFESMHADALDTLQPIVNGIESAPEEAAKVVKEQIYAAMKEAKVFDKANAIVDALKDAA